MRDELNRCFRKGRLVHAKEPIPAPAFDFVWPSGGAWLGCNNLLCGECGRRVKNRPHWRLVRVLSGAQARQLYSADDWAALPELAEPSDPNRAYLCGCGGYTEHAGRYLDDQGPEADFLPFPFRWACAGHPKPAPPFELDGERIAEDTDWDALLTGVVRGDRATNRPSYAKLYPLSWAQRLYHLVAHTPLAAALDAAVSRLEASGEPDLRAAAQRFRRHVPAAA